MSHYYRKPGEWRTIDTDNSHIIKAITQTPKENEPVVANPKDREAIANILQGNEQRAETKEELTDEQRIRQHAAEFLQDFETVIINASLQHDRSVQRACYELIALMQYICTGSDLLSTKYSSLLLSRDGRTRALEALNALRKGPGSKSDKQLVTKAKFKIRKMIGILCK